MKLRLISAFLLTLLFVAVSSFRAADCQKVSESCVEGPQIRNIGGYPVYRDCWRYSAQFSCVSQAMTDDCQPLIARHAHGHHVSLDRFAEMDARVKPRGDELRPSLLRRRDVEDDVREPA